MTTGLSGPDDVFRFGKYIGRTYRSVIKSDPQYISWAIGNVTFLRVTDEVKRMTMDAIRMNPPVARRSTYRVGRSFGHYGDGDYDDGDYGAFGGYGGLDMFDHGDQ